MTDENDENQRPPTPTGTARMVGGDPATTEPPQQPAQEQPSQNGGAPTVQQMAMLVQQAALQLCFQTLSIAVRGTSISCPQVDPPDIVTFYSRAMGMFVGTAFHGPLADVLNRRRLCREAFIDGLQKSPPPPTMQATPDQRMMAWPQPKGH